MPSSSAIIFICSNCEAQSSKWAGRCFECGKWGTLEEGSALTTKEAVKKQNVKGGVTIPFTAIAAHDALRLSTGMREMDHVLGGGIVPGSLTLLGGEPGIGKSTLMLHIAAHMARENGAEKILYCSGEESAHQIKLRYDRLNTNNTSTSSLLFLPATDCETICATITAEKPTLAIVDSIQTISSSRAAAEAGSVSQVRACTAQLLETAKQENIPVILTGHVTKEGSVAGPKTLEHLVDTVLYLEGDEYHAFRILKAVKNRFGSTNETGIFEMRDTGLIEVADPSAVFLEQNEHPLPGTVTTVVLEGSRSFLLPVQALTTKTYFGYPQRRAVGFDTNRLQLLIAVLTKRLGVNLGDQDIHINIVGGMKSSEPALDAAVCASILSAYHNKTFAQRTLLFGEVGLGGELRPVTQMEKRLKEAERRGFTTALIPKEKKPLSSSLSLIRLSTIKDLAEAIG